MNKPNQPCQQLMTSRVIPSSLCHAYTVLTHGPSQLLPQYTPPSDPVGYSCTHRLRLGGVVLLLLLLLPLLLLVLRLLVLPLLLLDELLLLLVLRLLLLLGLRPREGRLAGEAPRRAGLRPCIDKLLSAAERPGLSTGTSHFQPTNILERHMHLKLNILQLSVHCCRSRSYKHCMHVCAPADSC